jgi:pimeloyl-ACP methyl ester carboxylesterase
MKSFKIDVSQEILNDLNDRLGKTRWPDEIKNSGWNYGTSLTYLKELIKYWREEFDWRNQEKRLNKLPHFKAEINGLTIHFIYIKGNGAKNTPLLLLHGWPSSFIQMLKIIPLLRDSFDIVVPSLVGYGFSDTSREPGMSVSRMAEIFHDLMTSTLGYKRYAGRGSDLGAGVIRQLAMVYPENVIGIHVGGTNPWIDFEHLPGNMTEAEKEFVANAKKWSDEEKAYAMLHASKPQTLAYGLNDSPVGLAAWIVEKFHRWSDCGGDVERRFTKDELLTNIMIYWVTQTINSSMRLYYETMRDPGVWKQPKTPVALLMSSKDVFPTPREWAERQGKANHYTEIDRGGHFLEWEESKLVAEDIKEFFKCLN